MPTVIAVSCQYWMGIVQRTTSFQFIGKSMLSSELRVEELEDNMQEGSGSKRKEILSCLGNENEGLTFKFLFWQSVNFELILRLFWEIL